MKELWSYLRSVGYLIAFLVVLYLINFFNYGFIFGYILAPLIFVKRDFLLKNLDFNFLLLGMFSIVFALFYAFQAEESRGLQYVLIYGLTPPTFYLLGKYLTGNVSDDKSIFFLLFTIVSLFSFTGVCSVFANFLEGGFAQLDRNLPNFWGGQVLAATLMGSYFTFNMCIPALLIAYQGKIGKIFIGMAAALFVVSLICVLRLGSRTQLAICGISAIASLIYTVPRQSAKKSVLLFLVLGGMITYILTHVSFDLNADWLTTFAGRLENSRNSIASGGGRTDKWIKSFEYLFSHPLGWSVRDFGFSHNLWLDVARVAGVIPFLLLVVFSCRTGLTLYKSLRLTKRPFALNIMLLIYGLGLFLVLSVEPILDGIYPLFAVFCIYAGILNKYYENWTQ